VGRYWLSGVVQRVWETDFPAGTFAVNVLGSFVVTLIMTASFERGTPGPNARIFLTVGVCGGFTTMSTFSYETVALLRTGQLAFAVGNVAATLTACLVAAWLGDTLGRLL
jgi:fluoride exporter